MSRLNICTSNTRPVFPNNGDMLFETDTQTLIVYYDGWRTYGASDVLRKETQGINISTQHEPDGRHVNGSSGDMFVLESMDQSNLYIRDVDSNIVYVYSDDIYNTLRSSYDTRFERDNEVTLVTTLSTYENISTAVSGQDIYINNSGLVVFESDNVADVFNKPGDMSRDVYESTGDTVYMASTGDAVGVQNSYYQDAYTVNRQLINTGRYINDLSNMSFNLSSQNMSGSEINYSVFNIKGPPGDESTTTLWFKLYDTPRGVSNTTDRVIFGHAHNSHTVRVKTEADGRMGLQGDGYFASVTAPVGTVSANHWHNLTIMTTKTTELSAFLDGHPVQQSGSTNWTGNAGFYAFGSRSLPLNGAINSIVTWNYLLTGGEFNQLTTNPNFPLSGAVDAISLDATQTAPTRLDDPQDGTTYRVGTIRGATRDITYNTTFETNVYETYTPELTAFHIEDHPI